MGPSDSTVVCICVTVSTCRRAAWEDDKCWSLSCLCWQVSVCRFRAIVVAFFSFLSWIFCFLPSSCSNLCIIEFNYETGLWTTVSTVTWGFWPYKFINVSHPLGLLELQWIWHYNLPPPWFITHIPETALTRVSSKRLRVSAHIESDNICDKCILNHSIDAC